MFISNCRLLGYADILNLLCSAVLHVVIITYKFYYVKSIFLFCDFFMLMVEGSFHSRRLIFIGFLNCFFRLLFSVNSGSLAEIRALNCY